VQSHLLHASTDVELESAFTELKRRRAVGVVVGGQLTRHGLEEYVSDCVILLDHRLIDQISTRRLRIVKYRGTTHGTNEYPFLIDEDGISVLPITSMGFQHEASDDRISSGIPQLDAMLGGEGYFQGSSVLVSGTAGSGKTSLAAHFVHAACQRGERCLYFAFEESQRQLLRNMRSIGIDLQPWVKKGLLSFHAIRSTLYGLEMHLATFHKLIREFDPQVVVIDPIGSLMGAGSRRDATLMLTRLIDFLKAQGITALLTNLTSGENLESTDVEVSSLVDTWLLLRDIEVGGERTRAMYVLKSRGMAHSNQIREFLLTDRGIELTEVYLGPGASLTGSMRKAQEAREKAAALARQHEAERKLRERERKRATLEARIAEMRKEFEAEEREAQQLAGEEQARETLALERKAMGQSRRSDAMGGAPEGRPKRERR
jgi:circadian clock protein KaiC